MDKKVGFSQNRANRDQQNPPMSLLLLKLFLRHPESFYIRSKQSPPILNKRTAELIYIMKPLMRQIPKQARLQQILCIGIVKNFPCFNMHECSCLNSESSCTKEHQFSLKKRASTKINAEAELNTVHKMALYVTMKTRMMVELYNCI